MYISFICYNFVSTSSNISTPLMQNRKIEKTTKEIFHFSKIQMPNALKSVAS